MVDSTTGLTPEQQQAALEQAAEALFQSNLGLYLGPWIMGFACDFVLFGIMCHQLIHWLSFDAHERPFVKVLLAWAVLCSTATTCFAVALAFHLFVYNFGTYSEFLTLRFTGWYTILDPGVALPVQLFYAERAYRLNKNQVWIPIIGVMLALGGLAGAIGARIVADRYSFSELDKDKAYFWVWFSFTFVCDSFLTVMILRGLWTARTGWSETDRIVKKLFTLSVEAQMGPTVLALVLMITYAVSPGSYMLVFWEIWHPKAYVCAFLAVLNAKFSLRAELALGGEDSTYNKRNENTFTGKASKQQQHTVNFEGIKVDTTTFTESHEIPTLRVGINRQPPPPIPSDSQSELAHGDWDAASNRYLTESRDVPV